MSEQGDPLLRESGALPWDEEHGRKRSGSRWVWLVGRCSPLSVLLAFAVTCTLYLLLQSGFRAEIPLQASEEDVQAAPSFEVLLHPKDHKARAPTTTYLFWNVTQVVIAPDGVEKRAILINGQFPGPTVEARSGDLIVVEVLNLADEPISLHWHGLHMRGANDMDGPVGVTQCAISPGDTFTYHIPTAEQAGTFWYHGHSEVQRADGLYGGLVIHDPRPVQPDTPAYDHELLLLVSDWYHIPGKDVLDIFLDRTNDGHEPCPDSLLINGVGHFQCTNVIPVRPVNCSEVPHPMLQLDKSLRYRIRLVNTGTLVGFTMTVPDAELYPFEIDGGQRVASQTVNSVGVLYPAQRLDIILSWPEASVASGSEMIISMDHEFFLLLNPALNPTQRFSIVSGAVKEAKNASNFNLREAKGLDLGVSLPDADMKLMIFASIEILSHNKFIPQAEVNNTHWTPQETPLLATPRQNWNADQLVPWTGDQPVWVELTINNFDTQGHPFHLHGFDFYVIGSHEGNGGWDYYNPFKPWRTPRGGAFNRVDPVKRDTVYVPPYGYTVIQFLADNEGIWALHCHILWHQASGMTMAIQVLGNSDGLSGSVFGVNASQYCKKHKRAIIPK